MAYIHKLIRDFESDIETYEALVQEYTCKAKIAKLKNKPKKAKKFRDLASLYREDVRYCRRALDELKTDAEMASIEEE